MSTPVTPIAGALWWIDQGATLVRLARHSKRPAGRGGQWQTTTDPAVTRGWFAARDTSYGVLCGVPLTSDPTRKLVASDHDAYKSTARPLHLPPTIRQTTPRGGTHHLYRAPLDLRLAANGEPALDIKGGGRPGYVVGAGSQIRIDDTLRYYRLHAGDASHPRCYPASSSTGSPPPAPETASTRRTRTTLYLDEQLLRTLSRVTAQLTVDWDIPYTKTAVLEAALGYGLAHGHDIPAAAFPADARRSTPHNPPP